MTDVPPPPRSHEDGVGIETGCDNGKIGFVEAVWKPLFAMFDMVYQPPSVDLCILNICGCHLSHLHPHRHLGLRRIRG